MKNLISLIIFSCLTLNLFSQESVTIEQENSPFIIKSFSAKYQSGGSYSSEGVRFDVEITNNSGREIVAYMMGFYAFDTFNRSLGRPFNGYSIDNVGVGKTEKAAWVNRYSSSALFDKYGTGLAYVSKVRFKNGEIWENDASFILSELQKFEESLTLEDLQTEKDN
jgi:hypothetical protein